jgi:hypothetical protein
VPQAHGLAALRADGGVVRHGLALLATRFGTDGGQAFVKAALLAVEREAFIRSEPSTRFLTPERAACVIWSYWRPHGSFVRFRKRRQNERVANWMMLAMV